MRRFGAAADDHILYTDIKGERIPVSRNLFTAPDGSPKLVDGPYKSREKWLEYLAETIRDPVEIRAHMEPVRAEIKRRQAEIRHASLLYQPR